MILKVRHVYVNESGSRQDWLYFDGFNFARFLDRPLLLAEVRKNCENYDYVAGCDSGTSKSATACVVEINRDGKKYSIVFDSVAYLLNDAGKTVDTFVAFKPREASGSA